MRLYYMTTFDVAINKILPQRRLKVSLYPDLNDPFELQPYSLRQPMLRKITRALSTHYAKTYGIICMSDNWRSPVMWAHYAEKHKGVCLGFDVQEEYLGQVVYEPERLEFELKEAERRYGIGDEFIKALRHTKASEWAYEREWRLTSDLKEAEDGRYYVDLGPIVQLREVIMGARTTMPVGQVAKLVKHNPLSVQVMKTRPAFLEFAMVRNKRVSPITVKAKRT